MIIINNNIDSNFRAKIYYKDKLIGECLNELAFLDVRLQIKEEEDSNYSFELVKQDLETGNIEVSDRFKFDKNGTLVHPMSYDLYWPSYESILNRLLEF